MTRVSSRHETDHHQPRCAAPACDEPIRPALTGRPARFCSDACRVRTHRLNRAATNTPVTVEVDMGSASSRARPPERAWLVRLRRADRSVIVAIGLRHNAADRLAEQISDLLADSNPAPPTPKIALDIYRSFDVEASALSKRGWSISAIARHLCCARKPVRADLSGKRVAGVRRSSVPDPMAPFLDYVKARFVDDPHLWASALFDEIVPLGYDRAYPSFARQLRLAGLRPHCEACSGVKGRESIEIDHPGRLCPLRDVLPEPSPADVLVEGSGEDGVDVPDGLRQLPRRPLLAVELVEVASGERAERHLAKGRPHHGFDLGAIPAQRRRRELEVLAVDRVAVARVNLVGASGVEQPSGSLAIPARGPGTAGGELESEARDVLSADEARVEDGLARLDGRSPAPVAPVRVGAR